MRNMVLLVALAILTCLGGISVAMASEVMPKYSYINLGTLGGDNSYPTSLNDLGMASLQSQTADPDIYHSALWKKDKPLTDLGVLSILKNGAAANLDRSYPWLLNFSGSMVVGEAWNADYDLGGPNPMLRAFLWKPTTGMVDLGTLGGTDSTAYWINDNGWVVGRAETSSPNIFHAYYWASGHKALQDIDKRRGKQSIAWAVNNLNQVIGQMELTDNPAIIHAFLWKNATSGMKDLGTLPGGSSSKAYAISYSHICGISTNAAGANRAVLWHTSLPGITELGDLGGPNSYAYGINDWGEVVGYSATATPGEYHAFIWTREGGMQDLAQLVNLPPGLTPQWAISINSTGQILTAVWDSSLGVLQAFLLTPN